MGSHAIDHMGYIISLFANKGLSSALPLFFFSIQVTTKASQAFKAFLVPSSSHRTVSPNNTRVVWFPLEKFSSCD